MILATQPCDAYDTRIGLLFLREGLGIKKNILNIMMQSFVSLGSDYHTVV